MNGPTQADRRREGARDCLTQIDTEWLGERDVTEWMLYGIVEALLAIEARLGELVGVLDR